MLVKQLLEQRGWDTSHYTDNRLYGYHAGKDVFIIVETDQQSLKLTSFDCCTKGKTPLNISCSDELKIAANLTGSLFMVNPQKFIIVESERNVIKSLHIFDHKNNKVIAGEVKNRTNFDYTSKYDLIKKFCKLEDI